MAAQAQVIERVEWKLEVLSNIGDDLLAVAYLRMKNEGLLPYVFWEQVPELQAFLNWCNQSTSLVVGCFVTRSNVGAPIELAGLGWVRDIKTRNGHRRGDAGEVFWREWQAAGVTEGFGKLLLEFAFGPCKMDYLYGITPEKNIPAVRFMRHMGFRDFGPIPGLCCLNGVECGGVLSVLGKEQWLQRSDP